MEFRNPIVAGEELAITAIRSQDYVESSNGWRIARDGSTQLGNVSALGDFGATGTISANAIQAGPGGLLLNDNTDLNTAIPDMVDRTSKVVASYYQTDTGLAVTGAFAEQKLIGIDFTAEDGHWYMLRARSRWTFGTNTDIYQILIRANSAAISLGVYPNAPTTGNSIVGQALSPGNNQTNHVESELYLPRGSGDIWYRAILTVARVSGTSNGTQQGIGLLYGKTILSAYDMGYMPAAYNTQSFSGYDASVTPPTVPTPKTYTKTYQPVWSRSYDGDNSTTFDDSAHCYHGQYSSGTRGNTKSLVGFNYTTIQSDLAGSTINSVYLYVTIAHAYYTAGVDIYIGGHSYTSKPSTWAAGSVSERILLFPNLKEGSTYALHLTGVFGPNFRSGAYKGIAVGPPSSTAHDYYGYLYGQSESNKPYLVINYTK